MSTLAVTLTVDQLRELVREAVRLEHQTGPELPEVLTLTEAAEFLRRHPKVVMQLTRETERPLPVHFISKREPRFRRSELLSWLSELPGKDAA